METINEGVSSIMKVRKKLPGWVKRQILPAFVIEYRFISCVNGVNCQCQSF